MGLYFLIATNKGIAKFFSSAYYSVVSISALPISLLTIPTMNIDFRKSIFLRKIKLEKISKDNYLLLVFAYFFCVQFCIYLINSFVFFTVAFVTKDCQNL